VLILNNLASEVDSERPTGSSVTRQLQVLWHSIGILSFIVVKFAVSVLNLQSESIMRFSESDRAPSSQEMVQ
jgi:hypothetical protein